MISSSHVTTPVYRIFFAGKSGLPRRDRACRKLVYATSTASTQSSSTCVVKKGSEMFGDFGSAPERRCGPSTASARRGLSSLAHAVMLSKQVRLWSGGWLHMGRCEPGRFDHAAAQQ